RAMCRVGPGPGHDPGAVHGTDVVLVRGHHGVDESGREDPLLDEQLLQRPGAHLDRGERRGMMMLVAHAGSSQRSHRSTCTVSRAPAAAPHSSRAVKRTAYVGSPSDRPACAATSGTGNEPSSRTTTPRLPRTYRGQRVWPSGWALATRTAEPTAKRGAAPGAGGSGGGSGATGRES